MDEVWVADEGSARVALVEGVGANYQYDAVVTGSENTQVYQRAARGLVVSVDSFFRSMVAEALCSASMEGYDAGKSMTSLGVIQKPKLSIFQ